MPNRDPSAINPCLAKIGRVSSHPAVYEPSDDSFALADALAAEVSTGRLCPNLCIEIGSGSGYVICSLALLIRQHNQHAHCIATDVNPQAVLCTSATLQAHKVGSVDVLTCDLLLPLMSRIPGKVDLLVFNPPYVPTPDEEVKRKGIAQAWAGGMKGRVVIDQILPKVSQLLSPGGQFFIMTVAENDPDEILGQMEACGLHGSVLLTRQADEETLKVLQFTKPTNL